MFIKYNETPVVKSSNLQMSFIQLFAQLITVVIMPFLFIGDPNPLICVLRPSCIGLLLTVSTCATMSKTRTLLRIFQSSTRMSKKEQLLTKLTEYFILLLFMLLSTSILLVSFQNETPNVLFFVSDEKKYRERYCNTDTHIVLQFGFVLMLLVFNTIIAVRARHLPANLKETRIIILSNILSVVIVGNVLWLSFLQKSYYWKSVFLFYAIFLLNGINFVILYTYKLYILLFVPEKNTKAYFNTCINNKIKKQVDDQIEMNEI